MAVYCFYAFHWISARELALDSSALHNFTCLLAPLASVGCSSDKCGEKNYGCRSKNLKPTIFGCNSPLSSWVIKTAGLWPACIAWNVQPLRILKSTQVSLLVECDLEGHIGWVPVANWEVLEESRNYHMQAAKLEKSCAMLTNGAKNGPTEMPQCIPQFSLLSIKSRKNNY